MKQIYDIEVYVQCLWIAIKFYEFDAACEPCCLTFLFVVFFIFLVKSNLWCLLLHLKIIHKQLFHWVCWTQHRECQNSVRSIYYEFIGNDLLLINRRDEVSIISSPCYITHWVWDGNIMGSSCFKSSPKQA